MELELAMSLDLSAVPVRARGAIGGAVLLASALVYVADVEDYRGEAHIPVKGDKPTIGYGSTRGVKLGDRTTPAKALRRLGSELHGVYADGIKKCITAPLYDHEFSAFVALSYNIGVPAFCKKAKPGEPPHLIDLINAQRYAKACKRIEAFKHGPGRRVLPGLVKRRAVERAMCEGRL